ncbi:hypothetical protein SS05631_a45770 (plasmid) [Sinorhizobium sp. CCBAU 05631]|nr:hypothetical protein SS05631_a45770 [Sinorhizobium sp. CCBAU 05631]ASY74007.1 hypothetical protein SF83666_a44190 [Sinorhizobium fredii CCBAU 83666]
MRAVLIDPASLNAEAVAGCAEKAQEQLMTGFLILVIPSTLVSDEGRLCDTGRHPRHRRRQKK